MKKKIRKLIFMILTTFMFLQYVNVFAIDACTNSEMERLRELANNVEFKTNYKVSSVDDENKTIVVKYSIEILNFDSDLKISYTSKYGEEGTLKSDSNVIDNLYSGDKVTFKIYSYTDNLCTDEILKTVNVDLVKLNTYYYFNKEKCENNPDFKYCQEFMDTDSMDFDFIDKELDKYLNQDNNVSNILKNNSYILPITIALGLVITGFIIYFAIRKVKKREKDDL